MEVDSPPGQAQGSLRSRACARVARWAYWGGDGGWVYWEAARWAYLRGAVRLCGASPPGTQLDLEKVLNERKTAESGGFGWLEQLANSSHPLLRKAAIGGHRLSTTSNLVTVSRADGCIMHLGVGHVHRSEGKLNKAMFGEASGPRRRRGR